MMVAKIHEEVETCSVVAFFFDMRHLRDAPVEIKLGANPYRCQVC